MKLRLPLLLLSAVLTSLATLQANNVSGTETSLLWTTDTPMLLADETVVYNPAQGETQIVNDPLSGAGEIRQEGLGTVSLTGAVTDFIGSYVINGGGTLQFNSGAGTINGTTILSNNSTVDFNIASGSVNWAGTFEGTGNITKTGSGTLTIANLSGDYGSGNVTIQSGTVSINAGNGVAIFGSAGSTGSITIMNGATLSLLGNNNVFHKNINLQNGSRLLNDDAANLTFNGDLNITGEAKIEITHDKQMTLNGALTGDANAVLNLVVNASSAYPGTRSLTLSGAGGGFNGTINLSSLNTAETGFQMTLIINNDTAASNALVNVAGNEKNPSKLILSVENATIRKLTGTQYGLIGVGDGINSATLTLKEGGTYAGAFDTAKPLNIINNGALTLGSSAGSTFAGALSGTGSLNVVNGGTLTLTSSNSYTGETIIGTQSSLILSGSITNTSKVTVESNGTLTLNSGGSITNSPLVLKGGKLVLNNGATQIFNGIQLFDGTASSLTVSGAGSVLNAGTITGMGTLLIQGTDSITGTIQADHLFAISFTDGTNYYNAQISGANIVKGNALGDLTATSNDGSQNYQFRNTADLTMSNGAGTLYTIGGLYISGTGKTLTLGAGGLKINGNLTYANSATQITTISGGPLNVGSILKTGAGDLKFNSQVTAGSLTMEGNVIFTNGGSISQGLSGTGTIKLEGNGKLLSLSGSMGSFNGSANLADGTTMQFNATGTPTFTDVGGTGTFKVDAGQINIVGPTCTAPAGSEGSVEAFAGPAFNIGQNGTVFVDHRGLTSDTEAVGLPYAPRTIKNLTGSGTLILKTVGGDESGGYPGHAGSSVYVGQQGFTGRIVVQQGFLGFYAGNWGEATIVLDGGALGNGTNHQGGYEPRTRDNNIEVTSAGTIIRLFGSDTLTLNGSLSGTGAIRRTDGGTLTFNGNTSGYTGNMNLVAGTTTFNGATGFGTLTVAANANLKGSSTTLNGLVYTSGTLIIDTAELTIGSGGITTTNATLEQAMTVSQFKASADWSLGSNITLNMQGTSGFNMDTQGNDVTLNGLITFASDAGKKITKSGAGTLTITQDNLALTGPLAVNGGTLRYEGTNFSSSSITMANGGILNFYRTQTLSQQISGNGAIQLDNGTSLNVTGQIFTGTVGLTMNGNSTVSFNGTASVVQNMGTFTVNSTANELVFNTTGNLIINMSNTLFGQGSELIVSQYDYSNANYLKLAGLTPWNKLEGVTILTKDGQELEAMVDTMGRLIAYQADIVVGSLVSNGNISYTYTSNSQYYGALEGKIVDFTQPFQFAPGASNYGFTLRDDTNTGTSATSFTVSSQLTDSANGYRTVSILGQANATNRTVTLTNTANSFTGDLTISNAVVKADAANPGAIGNSPVTILGTGNTVNINENATVDLATGPGSYTYSNNFALNGVNSLLKQTEGQHTLTGDINIIGTDGGTRTIQNSLDEGDLTLTGAMLSRGNTTLVLRTQSGENSRIVLSPNNNPTLNKLNVEGHVVQTKNNLSILNGMTLGSNASYELTSGSLLVGNSITSSNGSGKTITMGNGTTLGNLTDHLQIGPGITLNFAQPQGSITLDTGNGTITMQGMLGTSTPDNTLVKKGQGSLELINSQSIQAALSVDAGTLTLKENTQLSMGGNVTLKAGTTLNLEKGSALNATPGKTFTFNGSLTGEGSLSGVDRLTFINGARYAARMSEQTWNATFQSGSTFSGSLLKHSGNIVFESGSHIVFDTTLPVSDNSIGISTTGGHTVRFNGATVSGTSNTPEIDWDTTQSYLFTIVKSQRELLGLDGTTLTQDNLAQSIFVGKDAWGAFLNGELSLSEDSKELLVTITRNGNVLASYSQTGNQLSVANALDYAMDNYSSLGLRGTELGDVIQYFNKMGQNIAAEAPEALGMVGGLSNYQALAGQRTDMMRHLEAVRQRANAGKGLVGISTVPNNAFWAEGTQGYSRIDGVDNSTPGYTAESWGAAVGVDFLSAKHYSLGVAFAYSNLTVDSNQYAGQTKADNYYVDLYGRWESGNWNGVFVLSGGTADVDVKRSLNLGSETYQGKGSTDGTQIIGMAEVAYDWQWEEEGPVLQPYLGMAVGGSKLDGYTESGLGNAGLVMDEQKQTVAQASLGVRLYKQNIDREMQYETSRWELRCGLVEEFGDTDFVTRSSFIGLPGYTMSTTSDDIGRTGLQIGGGFSRALGQAWSVFGDVNGEFRNGQTSMNSTLGLRCVF